MASLKEVKTRINSVKSTRKITSAMKMVASAKLHKAQGAIENMPVSYTHLDLLSCRSRRSQSLSADVYLVLFDISGIRNLVLLLF